MPRPKGAPGQLRIRLGVAMRDLRIAAGLSQTAAAQMINSKQPKVSNLETADVDLIKMADLNALLDAYGVPTDGPRADELRQWARSPYNGSGVWVDAAPGALWWQQLREIEANAKVIRAVHLQAMDGLLQCEPYMRRQFELGDGINVEVRVRARLARQDAMFNGGTTPPECTFVLDEACFHKNMGDPALLVTQVEHLLELAKLPWITILVLPFDALFPTSTYGFTLLEFNSAMMNDFVSVEYAVGSATIDDETAVRSFIRRWELIRSAAMSEFDTILWMRRRLGQLRRRTRGLTKS